MWNKAGQRSYDCYSTFELVNRSIDRSIDSGSMNHSLFCLGLDWILMKTTDMFSVCLALDHSNQKLQAETATSFFTSRLNTNSEVGVTQQ